MVARRRREEPFDGVEALLIGLTVTRPGEPEGAVVPDDFGITTSPAFPRRWAAHGADVLAKVSDATAAALLAAYGPVGA